MAWITLSIVKRYDGRGHLYDLKPYDADTRKRVASPVLTEDEKNMEKLCDEERYLELHTDLAEKTMYEEEEWKRYYESLSEGYKAVGFSYDAFGNPQPYTETDSDDLKPDDQPCKLPAELQVPPDVQIPTTIKQNAIIEKTAKFIAEHGVQMEIVMKTKQANNASFLFMHFENELHPFYRHMVKMIKSKKYIPISPVKSEPKDSNNETGEGDLDDYLHPTLMTSNRASPTPEPYKPIPMPKVSIHETSYGQLLQSFSKVNKEASEKRDGKEIKTEVKSEADDDTTLPTEISPSSYSSSMPPPPGLEPVLLPKPGSDTSVTIKQEPKESEAPVSTSPPAQIVPPPPDVQPIIDRMAMYVAKNGDEFSMVVKSKNDTRFQFLEGWHPHYPYYNFKRHLFKEEMEREKEELEAHEARKEKERAELLAKGVKFKLKKAKESDPSASLEKQAVFDYESTDEDSDNAWDKRPKSASGTSTPVAKLVTENKTDEANEKKLAEQRMRDRIAASAREKLSQADKEQQIKLERKKKAAMFLSLLKSKNPAEVDAEKLLEKQTDSGRNTPVKVVDKKSSHKSKHKTRDRSRSRDRRSSRSHRSRSRSSGRSKKKKRKRSVTPPSAYLVVKRLPPPLQPRYVDTRNRYSRSPSRNSRHRSRSRSRGRSSKHRSRSKSPSRSKSKKKKRSRSPKSRTEDSSSHKKSSKKKKKKSRSSSKDVKPSSSNSRLAAVPEEIPAANTPSVRHHDDDDVTVISPVCTTEEVDGADTLEEGETRDTSPEPDHILDDKVHMECSPAQMADREEVCNNGTAAPGRVLSRSRSRSTSNSSHSASRSHSTSPRSRSKSPSRSKSRSRSKSIAHSSSVSRSGSPLDINTTSSRSRGTTPVGNTDVSGEIIPTPTQSGELNDTNTQTEAGLSVSESNTPSSKNVSSYMLDRVRALIKASKQVATVEEDMFADDT